MASILAERFALVNDLEVSEIVSFFRWVDFDSEGDVD